MESSRRTEIKPHLSEAEIDELLRETEDDRRLRRISFVKKFYKNDTIPKAAEREGRLLVTGACWAKKQERRRIRQTHTEFREWQVPES